MRVKNIRVLKNGVSAGYVLQKDGTWKFRFLKNKHKTGGDYLKKTKNFSSTKKLINTLWELNSLRMIVPELKVFHNLTEGMNNRTHTKIENLPSYKVNNGFGKVVINSPAKGPRLPGYADRIFYPRDGFKCLEYGVFRNVKGNDHLPVYSIIKKSKVIIL